MDCPVCGEGLREVQRSGVNIDVCPRCNGVWLDRGELEKILAMEGAGQVMAEDAYRPRDDDHREEHHRHAEHDDEHNERHGRRGTRRGFLGNLFESLGGDD